MPTENPLCILVITSRPLVGAAGRPVPPLDVAEERRRIAAGLRSAGVAAQVWFLPEATTGAVQAALLRGWDVAHFTGHGTPEGRLLLEDGLGVAHYLTEAETARLFAAHAIPLVVLSACYSEAVGRGLIAAGVPAVVAVDAQTPIADLAAIRFAEHFYGALAAGRTVGKAFEDGRGAVALDPKVGDAHPPRDSGDQPEAVWSSRFTLLGDGGRTLAAGPGQYEETVVPWRVGNLPRVKKSFVGRAREIARVVRAFEEDGARIVALSGAGGLGKTELSKAVAAWYVERGRITAGLWASASRDEGESVLSDAASLLGIAARVFGLGITEQTALEDQRNAVRDHLARQPALLLLDNWEALEGRRRAEILAFARSLPDTARVLVTSRDALPPGEARKIEIDTLAAEDAAALLARLVRDTGYFERNPGALAAEPLLLAAISDWLGGYPLAIEVVAGLTDARTLGDIWAALQQFPKEALEGTDPVTGEPRGVWTSLGLSYDALPEPERAMFRRMSALLAPALIEDIAAITEASSSRTVLDALVRRSLVRMRDGAYSLLPVVRHYAGDKVREASEDPRELHVRAVNHYGQKDTIEGALSASDHLFELAARFESRDAAERFIQFTQGFYQVLVTRGYWAESRRIIEQVITVGRALGDRTTEAEATVELGTRCYQVGEFGRAVELCHQARLLFEELGDKRGIAITLHQLGILAAAQGNYSEAVRLYEQSMKLAEQLGDKSGIANTLHELGNVHYHQGSYSEAMRLYEQSMKLAEQLGDKSGIATTLHQMGILAQAQGNHSEAVRLYERSMKLQVELGDKNGIASTLGQLGLLARVQGRMKESLGYLLPALALFEQLRSPYHEQARRDIVNVRDAVGEEQFLAWLRELSPDAEGVIEMLGTE